MLRPKSKGSGIMVSDFVDERQGYLALTEEEYSVFHKMIKPFLSKHDSFLHMVRIEKDIGHARNLYSS